MYTRCSLPFLYALTFNSIMSSRKNFVEEERDFLIETMSEKRDIFESPRKDFKTTQRKNSEWIKVT